MLCFFADCKHTHAMTARRNESNKTCMLQTESTSAVPSNSAIRTNVNQSTPSAHDRGSNEISNVAYSRTSAAANNAGRPWQSTRAAGVTVLLAQPSSPSSVGLASVQPSVKSSAKLQSDIQKVRSVGYMSSVKKLLYVEDCMNIRTCCNHQDSYYYRKLIGVTRQEDFILRTPPLTLRHISPCNRIF